MDARAKQIFDWLEVNPTLSNAALRARFCVHGRFVRQAKVEIRQRDRHAMALVQRDIVRKEQIRRLRQMGVRVDEQSATGW